MRGSTLFIEWRESMAKKRTKRYSMKFMQVVVERMQVEKNISQLARELGLDRSLIYNWKRKMEGRESVKIPKPPIQELQAKIGSLERVIGRQSLELDFFEGALRRIK